MQITFYGAARTVTGSQHLIEANGQRILLDCGLYQGPRAESRDRNQHLPFDARSVPPDQSVSNPPWPLTTSTMRFRSPMQSCG